MGCKEVEAFLSWLANDRRISASTHRQELSALLFLYKEVLDTELPWLAEIGRPAERQRLPVVLSSEEVGRLLACLHGEVALVSRLLYGAGMRLMEVPRVKDLDFDRPAIVVHEGKGVRSPLDTTTTAFSDAPPALPDAPPLDPGLLSSSGNSSRRPADLHAR